MADQTGIERDDEVAGMPPEPHGSSLPLHVAEARNQVLAEVWNERLRQDATWGEQNHPDGPGDPRDREQADAARRASDRSFAAGVGTWADVLFEEVCEAFAEAEPVKLRAELVQVAAVAVAWAEALDRREVAS